MSCELFSLMIYAISFCCILKKRCMFLGIFMFFLQFNIAAGTQSARNLQGILDEVGGERNLRFIADTIENAEKTTRILRREGIDRAFLVTHFWHMPRSVLAFEAVDMDVVPAPMGFVGHRPGDSWLDRLRPRAGPLLMANLVVHEWIGWIWYRWRYG